MATRSLLTGRVGRKSDLQLTPRVAFADAIANHEADVAGTRIRFFDWAMKVPEPKAGTLDFDAFPPQLEIYQEGADDKEAVFKKATQVGVSAWLMRWTLYHADTRGWTGLYVFPTNKDMWDYATLRVDPLLASPYLRTRRTPDDPDNKGMKGLGLGVVVFRGSESKRGLDSVDADHIAFDEYDTLDPENIPDAEQRVSSPLSPGLIRRVGVPSLPDYGIAKLYDQSDQRQWLVKCGSCREWQDIDFWKNVDQKRRLRVCRKCDKPLDVSTGQWVAKHNERDLRGYHLSRLIFPGWKVEETVKASKEHLPVRKKVFFNKHLGLAWADPEGRLSRQAIAAAQSAGGEYVMSEIPSYGGANLVTMGVDVASVRALNVRISEHLSDGSERKRALFIGTVDNFDDLGKMMSRYNVGLAGIDHLPDGRLSRSFAEKFPGRVYVVAFDTNTRSKDPQVIKIDDDMRHAIVRRTEAYDATLDLIRRQKNLLPMDLPEDYIEHMQAPNRVVEEDDVGRKTVYYRSTGPDDYAQAEVYDVVATEVWWYRQGLEDALREDIRPLEEGFEYKRSGLAKFEGGEDYVPGPDTEDYYDDELDDTPHYNE